MFSNFGRKEPWKTVNYLFRNYPVVTPLFVLLSTLIVGLAIVSEFAFGIVFIVSSACVYIYVIIRYISIGYRTFSIQPLSKGPQTGVLAIIDLKLVEYFCIAGIISGLYFIDTTPGKTKYISHPEFSSDAVTYEVWAYVLSVSIFVVSSTGFSSIIEAHLAAALVFATGVAIGQISNLVIVASVIGYLADSVQETLEKRRKERKRKKKAMKVRSQKKPSVKFAQRDTTRKRFL